MIDDIVYIYDKVRRNFGQPLAPFREEKREEKNIPCDPIRKELYTDKDPKNITLTNIPEYSEHGINTDHVETMSKGMQHVVGGWPATVDPLENNAQLRKETKRKERASEFVDSQLKLMELASSHMKENNHIDLFEEYFDGEIPDQSTESLHTKTLRLFKDPKQNDSYGQGRVVSRISMIQEVPHRFAAAYAMQKFQKPSPTMALESYVWDVNSPNEPTNIITPSSSITSLSFSNKSTDVLAAGLYNGQIHFWDLRTDKAQAVASLSSADSDKIKITEAEKSHYDAVFDVIWPNSKTGNECISVSPDGRVIWWDWRSLNGGPITQALLTDGLPGDRVLGGTRIDNSPETQLKYLIGTEQGQVMQVVRKPGNKGEVSSRLGMEGGKHHGPIWAIQRNPAPGAGKYFLTVGDWTAKIWAEDLKVPMLTTRYHDAYLTDGCWSSTRPGIFFLTRMDGWIDIWDYYYRQNEVCYSQKISDFGLTCLAVKPKTSDILIGDSSGSVTLLQLCKSLWEPQPKGVEEGALKAMFEREYNREKSLVTSRRQAEMRREKPKEVKKQNDKLKNLVEKRIIDLEKEFFATVKEQQERLEKGDAYVEQPAPQSSSLEEKKEVKKQGKKDDLEYHFEEAFLDEEKKEEGKVEEKKIEGQIEEKKDEGKAEEKKDERKEEQKEEKKVEPEIKEVPGKKEEAPGKKEEAFGKKDEAPGKKDEAPGKKDEAPGEKKEAPGKKEEVPNVKVPKPESPKVVDAKAESPKQPEGKEAQNPSDPATGNNNIAEQPDEGKNEDDGDALDDLQEALAEDAAQ